MDQNKKVSIIIPTFNRENLIRKAIDSVFLQDYQNFEILVIDDCSTDKTGDVIKSYQDNRIIYIKNKKNYGAAKSRNIGISKATGDFISFLDSDDEWLPEKLISELRLFEQYPDCIAVSFNQIFINGKNNKIIKKKPLLKGAIDDKKFVNQTEFLRGNALTTNDFTIRKKALTKINGFDEGLAARQDWDIWIRIAEVGLVLQSNIKMTKKFIFHGQQISLNLEKKADGTIAILNKYKHLFLKDETALFRIYLSIALLYIFDNQTVKAKNILQSGIKEIKNKSKRLILLVLYQYINLFRKSGARALTFFYKIINPKSYLAWNK